MKFAKPRSIQIPIFIVSSTALLCNGILCYRKFRNTNVLVFIDLPGLFPVEGFDTAINVRKLLFSN
jgi:hypothetical protein